MRYFLFDIKTTTTNSTAALGFIVVSEDFPPYQDIKELVIKENSIVQDCIVAGWNEFKNEKDYQDFMREKQDED